MLTVLQLLARAHDCERLAHSAGFEAQRPLLLELAAKWRRLAEDADERPAGQDRSFPDTLN